MWLRREEFSVKSTSTSCMENHTSGSSLVKFGAHKRNNNIKQLFLGWYEDDWFEQNLEKEKINCTREQMRIAAEGHLTTEALMWNQNNQRTISGMVLFVCINVLQNNSILFL